jgi:NADH dehydrogenase FAD-containing subunit
VGGGPTGVEFSAELHDFVLSDLPKYYPKLANKVNITLVQSADHILNTYDLAISTYAEQQFGRENINLITSARVIEVSPTSITVFDKKQNKNISIPCGMTVWAAGVAPTPLTLKVAGSIPEQTHNKALVADEFLRVKGIPNQNVYAVGDCLTVTQKKMMDKLAELFTAADADLDGSLSLDELRALFKVILPEYPHLQPYSHGVKKLLEKYDVNQDGKLQLDEFQTLLTEVDRELKSVPSTAQAASQAGRYLATYYCDYSFSLSFSCSLPLLPSSFVPLLWQLNLFTA